MAVQIKNSLSTFLEQSMILEQNSLETVSKISDALTSQDESVSLTLTDPNNPENTKTYQIPSFGYLKRAIDRIDNTLNTLTNISGTSNSRIKLSDGTYRRIITSSIPSEAPTITTVNKVTNFKFKSNWFFEDLLNPCLYVNVDLTGQIDSTTERLIVERYILTCDTELKKKVFDNNFKNQCNIDYNKFVNLIVKNGIGYTRDTDIRDIPPRKKRYSGTFKIIQASLPQSDYNKTISKTYTLSSLEYTDNSTVLKSTRQLIAGDYVEVNTHPVTTRYKVTYVDTGTNQVKLQLIEGGHGLSIGTTLKISSEQDSKINIEIPVGIEEREVVFIKAIDGSSNIPSDEWSPGIGFYSNELTYTDKDNVVHTLQSFYQQRVVDFGQIMLSYAKDYYPSLREGIKPDAPVLDKKNFKVVKINDQLSEYIDSDEFRSLVSEKEKVSSEISNLSNKISEKRIYLQTTNFLTTGDKDTAYNDLQKLINEQNTLVTSYNTLVSNIKGKTMDIGSQPSPKYRIRGFWPMPKPKVSVSSGEQKIIKFIIRYRYLSKNGNLPAEEVIPMTVGDDVVKGIFSNWNEVHTRVRDRVENISTGQYEWRRINIADKDFIKPNQCDIPINPGEQVEIQIKSVSEAGWPTNPITSEWSNPVTVNFEDFAELQSEDISEIIEQNRIDSAIAKYGLYGSSYTEHMSTSFYTGDKYFAHTAEVITSGFLTEEQTPITLYDKLRDLDRQLTVALEKINMVTGNLIVSLIDEDNKIYDLSEGSTTYVYAGDYLSEISELTESEKKGAIVTKTFNIDIKCDTETGLYLLSKVAGNRLSMCPDSRKCYYLDYGDSDSDDDNDYIVERNYVGLISKINYEFVSGEPNKNSQAKISDLSKWGFGTLPNSDDYVFIDYNGKQPDFTRYKLAIFGINKNTDIYQRREGVEYLPDYFPKDIELTSIDTKGVQHIISDGTIYVGYDGISIIGLKKVGTTYVELSDDEYKNVRTVSLNNQDSIENRIAQIRVNSPLDGIVMDLAQNPNGNTSGVAGNNKFVVREIVDNPYIFGGSTYTPPSSYGEVVNGEDEDTDSSGSGWTTPKVGTGLSSFIDKTINDKVLGSLYSKVELNSTFVEAETSHVKPIKYVDSSLWPYINRYELYDNVINPITINSDYYMKYGRYDLVPINLSNSSYIDYQIASPNMYQSAQCCGQFIYSRFTNIDGTMDLYGNGVDYAGYGAYSDTFPFGASERVYGTKSNSPVWEKQYPVDRFETSALRKAYIVKDFENMIGEPVKSNVTVEKLFKNISLIMNRLPMTWPSRVRSANVLGSIKQTVTRLNNYNSVSTNLRYSNLLSTRLQSNMQLKNSVYTIKPKVQAAYGFGNIQDELSRKSNSEGVYLSTHKIGYEDKDRYAVGSGTCDSYLFLSPNNHESIQVDGDGKKSSTWVNKSNSISVPLVFQYRMKDYNGDIFGNKDLQEYDSDVKNTKYANIIGLDIWTDVTSETPKQFDIVVYSTYSGQANTDTGRVRTSTQVMRDSMVNIAEANVKLMRNAQMVSSPVKVK